MGDGGGDVCNLHRLVDRLSGGDGGAVEDEGDGHVRVAIGSVRLFVAAVIAGDDDGAIIGQDVQYRLDALIGVVDGLQVAVGHPAEGVTGQIDAAHVDKGEVEWVGT